MHAIFSSALVRSSLVDLEGGIRITHELLLLEFILQTSRSQHLNNTTSKLCFKSNIIIGLV